MMIMKTLFSKILPLWSLTLLLAFGLGGCKGTQEPDTTVSKDLGISQSELVMQKGTTAELEVTGGSGRYRLQIPKVGQLTGEVRGSKIILHALASGENALTLTDVTTGSTLPLKVTVREEVTLVTVPDDVAMYAGGELVLRVSGGSGDYTAAAADDKIATVLENTSGKIILRGVSKGSTTLLITDKVNDGVKTEVPVEVRLLPFEINKQIIEMQTNDQGAIQINSGNGAYEVSVDKPEVLECTVVGNAVQLKSNTKSGTAVVTIKDTNLDEVIKVSVKISYRSLALDEDSFSLPVGFPNAIYIRDGNGSYSVRVTEGADLVTASVKDGVITVDTKEEGYATLVLKDEISGEEMEFQVEVRPLIQERQLSDYSLTLHVGETKQIVHLQPERWWSPTMTQKPDGLLKVVNSITNDYKPVYTIVGLKEGRTLLEISTYWDGVVAEIPVTVLPAK